MSCRVRQHIVVGLVPRQVLRQVIARADSHVRPPLLKTHVGNHVVLRPPHGLGHGVEPRAILIGGRCHRAVALCPSPQHPIQERPALGRAMLCGVAEQGGEFPGNPYGLNRGA